MDLHTVLFETSHRLIGFGRSRIPALTAGLLLMLAALAGVAYRYAAPLPAAQVTRIDSPLSAVPPPGQAMLVSREDLRAGSLAVAAVPVVEGMSRPIGIAHAGDGSGRLFVHEKEGLIRVIVDGVLREEPFLDLRHLVTAEENEQGLIGLAFAPDYAQSGSFFVNYTDLQGDTVVARYQVSRDPNRADPRSAELVLKLDQPNPMHNGGQLAWGPDGYLYIAVGDGGGMHDPFQNAQNGRTLFGSILRLDVSKLPYRIPPDNPFVGSRDVQDEIWVAGLRNPWRFSFDRLTGDLYIGDVGQDHYEEISLIRVAQPGNRNLGWAFMEGFECRDWWGCEQASLDDPLFVYDHDQGCAVTGGYVYRGSDYPAMQGAYLFGDFCTGYIWAATLLPSGEWQVTRTSTGLSTLASFGEDEAGELYAVSMAAGTLYRIIPTGR